MRWLLFLLCFPAFAAAPPMPSCTILGVPLCLPGYSVVKDSVNVTRGLTYPVGWPHTYNSIPLTANDCNLLAFGLHNAKMLLTPAAEKRAVEQAAWAAFFTYPCDLETAKRTDWIGKVCVEHINTLFIHRDAWLAKMPAQAKWVVAYNSACSDANKLAGTCTHPTPLNARVRRGPPLCPHRPPALQK